MKTHHRSLLAVLGVLILNVPVLPAVESSNAARFSAEHVVFFENDVLPILREQCFECHGGKPDVEGDFRITSRSGILRGGELGSAVELDRPGESPLLSAINYTDLEMPPAGQLPAEQIATLTRWVELGLPWSDRADYGVEPRVAKDTRGDGSDVWAYQPIQRPPIPKVQDSSWGTNPIDAFLLARLEAAGLRPAEPAGKVALIRRAYYDLTGLPPTPADVDRFIDDDSPQAFERVVDRLLESPRYGERWGRHWLDLVRYAETHGYERDSPKPEAWRYRDYVIQSFNADKPYDQFVIEQLAGDELPETTMETLTATGYYRLGIWDDEPADRELAHYDGLDDIVKTTAESVLGISMGCVRCHSHKADPIDHHEYYRFLAYFHDIAPPNRENLRHWATDDDRQAHAQRLRDKAQHEQQLAAEILQLEDRFRRQLKDQQDIVVGQQAAVETRVLIADSRNEGQTWEYTFEKPSDDWIQPDYSTTSWDSGPGGFGVQGTPGAVVRTAWSTPDIWLRKWFEVDLEQPPEYLTLELHHDEDCEVFINGKRIHQVRDYTKQYEQVPLGPQARAAIQPGKNVIAAHCRQTGGGQYVDLGLFIAPPKLDLETLLKQYGRQLLGEDEMRRLRNLEQELADSRKRKLPPPGTRIMAVAEGSPRPVHVLLRGNPHSPGDKVTAAVPAVLRTEPPRISSVASDRGENKRLALARWMFHSDNPLTARVIANRIWQHHFGRGIVPTPNDFGKLGEPPTHPQLLDWLAAETRDGAWKLKRMHKLIMLSSAWRMSSHADDAGLAKDPGNSLFWRFNMRRLSSEEIRDSILAVTGELNLGSSGPSVYVPIPQAVLQGQSRPGSGWGNSSPQDAARRSIYIHVKRSLLVPIMEMHDQADTDSSCPVRYVTTVPTQSLGMLNGDFTNSKAARLAERLQREIPDDWRGQIQLAIRLATGRMPSEEETAADLRFVESIRAEQQLDAHQAMTLYCLLTLNTNEFVYLD